MSFSILVLRPVSLSCSSIADALRSFSLFIDTGEVVRSRHDPTCTAVVVRVDEVSKVASMIVGSTHFFHHGL